MRKLIAMLLAALLLMSAAAYAEGGAAILTLDNLKLSDGSAAAAIDDMAVSLALQNVSLSPAAVLLIEGAGQPLAKAAAQLSTRQFSLAVDGMGYGLALDLPAPLADRLAEVGEEGWSFVLPMLLVPALDEFTLPPFTGANIPKADMSGLLASYMTGESSFEIPFAQVNAWLDQLVQVVDAQFGSVSGVKDALEAVRQLRENGIGVVIRGDIDDDGATQTVGLNVYPAQNERVGDDMIASVSVISSLNHFDIILGAFEPSGAMQTITLSLISDPAAARIDLISNISINNSGFSFSLYSEDGLQKASLLLNGGDEGGIANLEFGYGQQGGSDIVSLGVEGGGSVLSFTVDTVKGADGVRTGSMTLVADQNTISGDVTLYTGEKLDLGGFTVPSELRPFDQLDLNDIGNAFQPMLDYMNDHTRWA